MKGRVLKEKHLRAFEKQIAWLRGGKNIIFIM